MSARTRDQAADTPAIRPVERTNLTARVYAEMRAALLDGRFPPGHRFKIRELAASLGVSMTPVREALMQLVREGGLDMRASQSITVARLTLAEYLELRTIRLHLEGLAAEVATTRITDAEIDALAQAHAGLVAAEAAQDWREALITNARFHHTLSRASGMPQLAAMIEGIWLRNGPLLNFLYPDAHPTYPGRHQHLNVLDALRRRDPDAVREAVRADMIEGGAGLVRLLERIEAGSAPDPASPSEGHGLRRTA